MRVQTAWYSPWQRKEHSDSFDFRGALDGRNLVRIYETLNDVRLLKERFHQIQPRTLLEVGCATGDFFRYVQRAYPALRYLGIDISQHAVRRAAEKYPKGRFLTVGPDEDLAGRLAEALGDSQVDLVYSCNVVHHQTQPMAFIERLLRLARWGLILRLRTRDVGPTEWNPDRSRQFQYGSGWVPYLVMNFEELLRALQGLAPRAELAFFRSYRVLGGELNRDLPKEISLPKTRTAETAVGIFFKTASPGRVTVQNRPDNRPNTTLDHKFGTLLRKIPWIRIGRVSS
ncbi:MAG: class I SAM-dependent methyltransferase [Candidatus Omnitrophica bacterium]|nr:class I SAM-dependent methyltransferase [Candidatus Omnitrophota bacterium]